MNEAGRNWCWLPGVQHPFRCCSSTVTGSSMRTSSYTSAAGGSGWVLVVHTCLDLEARSQDPPRVQGLERLSASFEPDPMPSVQGANGLGCYLLPSNRVLRSRPDVPLLATLLNTPERMAKPYMPRPLGAGLVALRANPFTGVGYLVPP